MKLPAPANSITARGSDVATGCTSVPLYRLKEEEQDEEKIVSRDEIQFFFLLILQTFFFKFNQIKIIFKKRLTPYLAKKRIDSPETEKKYIKIFKLNLKYTINIFN